MQLKVLSTVAIVTAATAGIAVAATPGAPAPATNGDDVATLLPSLRAPHRFTAGEQRDVTAMRTAMGALPPGSIASTMDWSRAVPVDGTAGTGWLVAARGGVCTVITDPDRPEGAISCSSAAQVKAGEAYVSYHPSSEAKGKLLTVIPVAAGAAPPAVDRRGASPAAVRVTENAAAITTGPDDSITIPSGDVLRPGAEGK